MRDLNEVMRDEMVMRDRIIDLLREEPRTVPEIAEALGAPSREVMIWVMAMWRYGVVTEMEKARTDDYFSYRLKKHDREEEASDEHSS
jgi:predicted Rossmann fold nucleotide-binding protein DprA/Smf involved in DNA uptake